MTKLAPRWIAAIAAVALSLGIASCSTGAGTGATTNAGPVTVSFASWHWLEKGRSDKLQQLVDAYNQSQSRVRVEKREIARKDYERTLSTEFGARSGPDVFIVPDTYFAELSEAGVLEPLNSISDPLGAKMHAAAKDFEVESKQLAIPYEISPYAFFWNKKLLQEAGVTPPTTPEELLAASNQVKAATGKTGFAVRHQMNEEAVWWLDYANWPFGFGGAWSDGSKLTINDPKNIEALTAFKKMYDSGSFAVGDDASTFRSRFAQGEIAMTIDCLTCMRTVTGSGGPVTATDVDGGKLPFPGDSFTRVMLGFGVNANSKNKEAALDFTKWLYTDAAQQMMLDINFPSTAGLKLTTPAALSQAYPWSSYAIDNLDKSQSAVIPGFEDKTTRIRTIVLTEVARVLTQNASPTEALAAAQRQAEALS